MPPSVSPPGLFASATVTVPLNEVIRLPEPSSASTVRPKGLPAVTLAGGCWVTDRTRDMGEGRDSDVVADVREPEVAVGARRDSPVAPTRVRGDGVGCGVDLPIWPLRSANQRLPSGPAVIPWAGMVVGSVEHVMAWVVGLIWPIDLVATIVGEPEVAVGAGRDNRAESPSGWRTR